MKTNSDTTPKLYIGLDVHKEQTSVAIADPGSDGEIRSHGNISTTQPSIDKVLRRIVKARGRRKWGQHKWGQFVNGVSSIRVKQGVFLIYF